ncbi:valine--tRNA ligase [Eshraghiella crossota]|jgi:valyl-tRNA synthetase|uniref:valine--tRNA ligase n=1 Tax=Eshraghiella crossota TaxID=45851 RepID=UPI0009630D93|nr:MAG: valine--tRNA ligase [Butyrivibrio crossotus]
MKELEKNYNPAEIESRLYEKWENKKYFHAEVDRSKKPFTIVMPPPNITGQLHMGHALDNTLQDILIRFKRMQGYSALWVPGTDHASIATEAKVVEKIAKEGLTKESLGREKFLDRVWDWKKEYGGRIVKQLKKIGSSADWDRERFTMDEGCNKAVKEVFVNLYNKGLIYRGERIINWCPCCLTSISDAEVEYEDQAGSFWHLRYPLSDGSGYIEMATTRPETMLGDTAVAVNPNDERYKDYVGKTVILPIVHREIPIIADEYVDMEFGTGVVKITPAHDPNDFEVGLRHHLPVINVLTEDAKIVDEYEKYAGLDRYEARKAIVADLEAEGALVKIEPHDHNVGTCYRCHTTVEPRVSKQWFVKMEELAGPAIEAVKSGKTRFVPEHFDKTYYHWLENIKDWCISRQLWWGHRIPAFYCDCCNEVVVTKENKAVCPKCGKEMRQDPDTLDTWFSSALWPFSTLGWPDKTEDLDYFYPTSTLVTGYDIIFFWVIRMMFSGIEHTGKAPFNTILIHGLVRDSQGRKMSKSLGNGIDPLEVIDKYGADALRLTLITGNAPGNDMRFYWERVESSRNFANKVWNASRFIMMNLDKAEVRDVDVTELTDADKWILSKVNTLAKDVTDNMENYDLGVAVQKIYDFIWEEFCDWYIEMVKPRLWNDDNTTKAAALYTLKTVLINSLKLLHPYMPFITEEIFCNLSDEESIMISKWPEYKEEWNFAKEEKAVETIKEAVRGIRNSRTGMNVPPSRKAKVFVVSDDERVRDIFEKGKVFFTTLAYASEVVIQSDKSGIDEDAVAVLIPNATVYMPFSDLVDIDKEIERLKNEEKKLEGELKRVNGMLSNEKFISKAPEAKINEEKEKLSKYTIMMEQVKERLKTLQK